MNPLFVESVGILAPGLAGWIASREILAGEQSYAAEPLPATIPPCCRPMNGVAPPPRSSWRCTSRRRRWLR